MDNSLQTMDNSLQRTKAVDIRLPGSFRILLTCQDRELILNRS